MKDFCPSAKATKKMACTMQPFSNLAENYIYYEDWLERRMAVKALESEDYIGQFRFGKP